MRESAEWWQEPDGGVQADGGLLITVVVDTDVSPGSGPDPEQMLSQVADPGGGSGLSRGVNPSRSLLVTRGAPQALVSSGPVWPWADKAS